MKLAILVILIFISSNIFAQNNAVELKTIGTDSTFKFDNRSKAYPYIGGIYKGGSGDSVVFCDLVMIDGVYDTALVPVRRFDTNTDNLGKLIVTSSRGVEFMIVSPFVHELWIKVCLSVSGTEKVQKWGRFLTF